jgi:Na+/H+ antiporter NhaA
LFALANAGVSASGAVLEDAARSPVAWGVLLGLVVGKPVGIAAFSWLACRWRLASLPSGAGWPELVGAGALGGIGFTISLFVSDLAFDRPELVDEARIGILSASLVASLVGATLILAARRCHRSHR